MTLRVGASAAVGVLTCLCAAGCGGSSSGSDAPAAAAKQSTSDVFEVTASCDREAVVTGSSVTGDSVRGDSADVRLSSGARLGLQRSGGQWYISSISGGSPHPIKQGRCAGAG